MCSCHSILECCIKFSGVKLSMGSFVYLLEMFSTASLFFKPFTKNAFLFYEGFFQHT